MIAPSRKHLRRLASPIASRGFTLVELMVGMLLGLITVLVASQVLLQTESRKRTSTAGSDATTTGAMALYTIERDARNAGYGMTAHLGALGCEIRMQFSGQAMQTFTLAPVEITQGANGAPDTLRFMASNKEGVPLPIRVAVDHPRTAANFFVQSDLGVSEGDIMLAVPTTPDPNNWCSLFQVTNNTNPGGGGGNQGGGQGQNQVLHNSGQSAWNQAGGQTIFPVDGYPQGSTILNLGTFSLRTYAIVNNSLQLDWLETATGLNQSRELYPQVIQLQAQYGLYLTNDNVTNVQNADWVDTATAAQMGSVVAIRLAVVTRSNVQEKPELDAGGNEIPLTVAGTNANCQNLAARNPRAVCWAGGAINALNTNNPGATDWQRYRYRVFETVIPLRNMIWPQQE